MGLTREQQEEKKMSDLNIVGLVGRLSRDAIIQKSAKGDVFCKFTVAVNRSKKKDDVWEDVPSFFVFNLFGERAEKLAPYLVKGQAVSIEGHLILDRWESQGVPHARLDVSVDDIRLIGAAPGKATKEDQAGQTPGAAAESSGPEEEKEDDPDMDLGGMELTGESLA
jgi:single-strand DNA-binding protein